MKDYTDIGLSPKLRAIGGIAAQEPDFTSGVEFDSQMEVPPASVPGTKLGSGNIPFTTNIAWTASDGTTATWVAGTVGWTNGIEKYINAGTATFAAQTYVYYHNSPTLKTTTTFSDSVGNEKTLLAILENKSGGDKCVINPINQSGHTFTASNIVAGTMSADRVTGGTMSANYITGGTFDANLIKSGTITGRTVRTSASGERIVVDGNANSIKFYNSSGTLVRTIDSVGRFDENLRVYDSDYANDWLSIYVGDSAGGSYYPKIMSGDHYILFDSNVGAVTLDPGDNYPTGHSIGSDYDQWANIRGRTFTTRFLYTGVLAPSTGYLNVTVDESLLPDADNSYALGSSSKEWTEVWAYDTSINHSDLAEAEQTHPDYKLAKKDLIIKTETNTRRLLAQRRKSQENYIKNFPDRRGRTRKERLKAFEESNKRWLREKLEYEIKQERYSKIPVGSVVAIAQEGYVPTDTQGQISLLGVVSGKPGLKLGHERKGGWIAKVGRVPCFVVGKCKAGDLLQASDTEGCAEVAKNPQVGSVIGRAKEDKNTKKKELIEIEVCMM